MAQTRITKGPDSTCSYNQSTSPFFWTMANYQYNNTFVYGEVGLSAAGGTAGSYVRPDIIDVSSFLSGRDDILTKCNPPIPGLDEIEQPPMIMQPESDSILLPKYTKEKKSSVELSAIDYNRWTPDLPNEPQNLRFIIEDFSAQRGGLDTKNYIKSAWNPRMKLGTANNGNPLLCETILDPSFACGEYCDSVSGYSTFSGPRKAVLPGRPQADYPFIGITSQQAKEAGITKCAEQQFYGPNYDQGSCDY